VNILYVTSEVARYARTGGLADVSAALPQYLRRAGHDVRVFLPYYSLVDDGGATLEVVLRDLEIRLGGHRYEVAIVRAERLGDAPVHLVHCPALYHRASIYADTGLSDAAHLFHEDQLREGRGQQLPPARYPVRRQRQHGEPDLRRRDPDRSARREFRSVPARAIVHGGRHPERRRLRRVEPGARRADPGALQRDQHGGQGDQQGGAARAARAPARSGRPGGRHRVAWQALVANGMAASFSWDMQGKLYEERIAAWR
jgi:hypothetical protein